jgi:L-lysine 2,3-aminomutase
MERSNNYFKKLIKVSIPVRKQFQHLSSAKTFDIETIPFGGKLRHKELSNRFERLYVDRVVLRVIDTCPYICNFCYEKPKITTEYRTLPEQDIKNALEYIKKHKEINNILISGGSPVLLEYKALKTILDELSNIENVNQIYIAGGRPIFNPNLYSLELADLLSEYNRINYKKPFLSKKVGMSVHINHPDEINIVPKGEKLSAIEALNRFISKGILVYCQSAVLAGINDNKDTIEELCILFSQNNILPYYFLHPLNTPWEQRFRIPVSQFVKLASHMSRLSGHVNPRFIIATPVGKITITGTETLQYKIINGKKFVRLKTYYLEKEFKESNRLKTLPPNVEIEEGRLVVYYNDDF